MPYSREESAFAPEKKALVLVGILFFNLILISTQVILNNERSLLVTIISAVTTPFQKGLRSVSDSVSHRFQRFFFLQGVYRKYQDQKMRNTQLRQENYVLRQQLQDMTVQRYAKKKFPTFIQVSTISVDINFPFNTLVIDKGKASGIVENLPVLNLDGDLVGKTCAPVLAAAATVRLITSPIGGAGAYLEANMFEGFLTGTNSTTCLFKYLLENKPVQVGDRVVTSGTDRIFPAYLPVGCVTKVENDYLTKKVMVRPHFLDKPIKYLVVLRK